MSTYWGRHNGGFMDQVSNKNSNPSDIKEVTHFTTFINITFVILIFTNSKLLNIDYKQKIAILPAILNNRFLYDYNIRCCQSMTSC